MSQNINYYININPTNKKDLAQILQFLSPNKRHNDPPDSSDSVKTKKRKVTTKCKQEIVDAPTKCSPELQPEVTPTKLEYQPEMEPLDKMSVLSEFTPSIFTQSP